MYQVEGIQISLDGRNETAEDLEFKLAGLVWEAREWLPADLLLTRWNGFGRLGRTLVFQFFVPADADQQFLVGQETVDSCKLRPWVDRWAAALDASTWGRFEDQLIDEPCLALARGGIILYRAPGAMPARHAPAWPVEVQPVPAGVGYRPDGSYSGWRPCEEQVCKRTGPSGSVSWESMDREQAWQILCEFAKSENLRKHALAVEACVAAYARKFGEDETKWSVTALLHDFDWEIHPEAPDHPLKGEPILAERGVSEEIRRAVLSHASYSGVARESLLEKTLFACDEVAGFVTAVALVKPHRSLAEVDARSVRKKMKDKAFARSVNREDIINGAAQLGVDLDEHIDFCVRAMQGCAKELGLEGI